MTAHLLLSEQHPHSRRTAVFADDGASVWLYLTEVDSLRPAADCWLFNTVLAPVDLHSFRSDGGPPPATQQFAKPDATRDLPGAAHVHFGWSQDGQSVAAYVHDELLGFIVPGQKSGYSKNLLAAGPFGAPLDDERFKAFFA